MDRMLLIRDAVHYTRHILRNTIYPDTNKKAPRIGGFFRCISSNTLTCEHPVFRATQGKAGQHHPEKTQTHVRILCDL